MTYTYCERLMWAAIAPAAFRYLARQELGWDISALKQLSKQIYRQMVSRTPDIGSMMENPLRVCLTGGILWLSIYKAAEEKMSEKRFEGMVSASMRSPLVVAAFRGKAKTAFTLKAQYKRAATASLADADRNPFQWNAEVIFGRDAEEYSVAGAAFCWYLAHNSEGHANYRMCGEKRIHIGERMKYMPMGYFNAQSLGSLTAAATSTMSDLESISEQKPHEPERGCALTNAARANSSQAAFESAAARTCMAAAI